jgi:hypothetical protein
MLDAPAPTAPRPYRITHTTVVAIRNDLRTAAAGLTELSAPLLTSALGDAIRHVAGEQVNHFDNCPSCTLARRCSQGDAIAARLRAYQDELAKLEVPR